MLIDEMTTLTTEKWSRDRALVNQFNRYVTISHYKNLNSELKKSK